ncbi:unnamed protein product [Pseudo-nitzschia multistriata]|uniref:Plastid lipid-associated protein/fibrillin conserved domain-containing protein n=1 Tax=Pseudo-nitzschia multistriata TaxID=183589 RepID=A0A448Z0B2_9STRA|nr:unnamed protein product [Pseudo-nitzschia multistriata]
MRTHARRKSPRGLARILALALAVALSYRIPGCDGWSPGVPGTPDPPSAASKQKPKERKRVTLSSREYAEAMSAIDRSSGSGTPVEGLYEAVRLIDKNARHVYPDEASKEDLWTRAYGSWKLVLATGGGRQTTFKPVPVFAFAMLDETTFGNGVGLNEHRVLLSLRGRHELLTRRRQMVIGIDDVFLGSKRVTGSLPGFAGRALGLGKRRTDYEAEKRRPPAFVFLAASETSLVARGGSGGIAIWTRLEEDIRPAAYGDDAPP